ncbi:MAG: hypothetical protein NVS4B11_19200 [Ktedonobacteraceae bacterium]
MNCNQARSMFAAYRELKHGQIDTTELDVHLEQCAACRHVLAQQNVVGERVRLLPTLDPSPDAHAKLMQALAAEHTRFLQSSSTTHTSSASSVPDFLKPYMKEQTTLHASDTLRQFSSAETGPLPVLQMKHKKRLAPMGQFAVLGLAASFLMIFLVGGLVSLLLLANHGDTNIATSITRPSLIAPVSYTTKTSYPHVASAVATHEHIYYSAYGDGETQWMLEQVNGTPKDAISTPLLATSSHSPLFVLGASQQWLIWLQFDAPQRGIQSPHAKHARTSSLTRSWSLNALSLATPQNTVHPFGNTITLQHGNFDTATIPSWIHTPIQGLWFIQQDTLLVTAIDAKGEAQLVRYELDAHQDMTSTPIAMTSGGHVLTSPTATADGMRIFWSEEWFASDLQPHSNIWMQETTKAVTLEHGAWRPTVTVDKQLFRADEVSFHPQVVNDTLFLVSTADPSVVTQRTPSATGTSVVHTEVTSTPVSTAPVTSRFTNIYSSQIDESIHGMLLAIALDDSAARPTTLSSDSTSAALQAGTRFLIWQSSTGYQMYDAVAKLSIVVKDSTKDATFLAVNADAAVWVVGENTSTKDTPNVQTATFKTFNWPA